MKQYIPPQQTCKKSKAQSASAPRVFFKTTQKSIIFGQKPWSWTNRFFDFSASVKCIFKDCELPATTTPADFGGMYRSLNLNYIWYYC